MSFLSFGHALNFLNRGADHYGDFESSPEASGSSRVYHMKWLKIQASPPFGLFGVGVAAVGLGEVINHHALVFSVLREDYSTTYLTLELTPDGVRKRWGRHKQGYEVLAEREFDSSVVRIYENSSSEREYHVTNYNSRHYCEDKYLEFDAMV